MTTTGRPAFAAFAALMLTVSCAMAAAARQLRRAIVESADEKNIGPQKRIKLLDPKAALELIFR